MRPSPLLAALALAPILSARAQVTDSAAVWPAYVAAEALLDSLDREHGRWVELDGIRTHYLEWGEPGGVPFVWLHGSASSGFDFRALAPRLVALGYRVIAPCYRGHGLTRVSDYDFTIYHLADDMVALLDSLGLRAAVFSGSSKGGFVAAATYDQHPSRVLGLLLSDGGSWSNQWDFDHNGLEGARRQVAGGGPPRIVGASRFEVFAQLLGPALARAPAPPPADRLLEPLVSISRRPDGRWAMLDGFERLMGTAEQYLASATAPSTLPLLQWSQHAMIPLAVFRDLDVPLFIIDPVGEPDDHPMTDQNQRLARLHPDHVVLKTYEGTGHAAFRERPDWFVRDAGELLARIRLAGGRR
ncbi:MAG: alpha/beta hydrolase [Gemmatimonadales bacterium]